MTEEAFEAAKRRLKPRGLFCLALRVDRMTEAGLLRTIRSFVDSFSLASMWEVCPGRECVLVGEMAAGPGEEMQNTLDLELVRSRMREPGASKELARVGISDEVDLLGLFFMPRSGLEAFSREVPRGVTDDNCGTEVRTARAIHSSLVADFNLNAYRHHVVKFVSGMPGDPAARTALAARFARVRSGRELALISRQFAAMGRPDRALAAARVAERVDARNYSARLIVDGERLSEGSVAFGAGQLSGALGRLEEFCPRNAAEAKLSARTRAKILAERARKRLEAGDAARALADSERSIGLAPHWPVIIMARARLLKELGRYTDAITVAESALRELTPSAGIVAFKAECYRLAGDPKQAAELLDTALVSEPANVALLVTRGKVYQDLGELADAVYCFDTAARQTAAPEFIRPLRGKALLELGRYREAVAELLAASAHFPGDGDIRLDLAKAYFYFGQQDLIEGYGDNGLEKMSKAEVNCVVAIDLGADEGRARLVLASIALKTDRLEEADIYLARARQVGAKPSERLMKAFEQGRKGRPTLEE